MHSLSSNPFRFRNRNNPQKALRGQASSCPLSAYNYEQSGNCRLSLSTFKLANVVYVGDEDTVYYGQGEISPDDIIRVPSSVVEVPDEMASADEDTIYYGQDEISPDDIIRVPSSTVEVLDEESTESNN